MLMRHSISIATLIVGVASSILTCVPKAAADPRNVLPSRFDTIPEAFDRAFFSNDRDAFTNRSILRQLNSIFGPYPENEINRDGQAVHKLYVEVLEQQVSSDPILRTPDLPNPYNTSLLQLSSFNVNRPVTGTEFIYEQQPPR